MGHQWDVRAHAGGSDDNRVPLHQITNCKVHVIRSEERRGPGCFSLMAKYAPKNKQVSGARKTPSNFNDAVVRL